MADSRTRARRYEHLRATRDSLNFAVWYGLGDCHARDTVIVTSAASPSGYRFRSGYESAIRAYTKALTLVPTAHLAFAGVGFERLSELLFTQSRELRRGARDGDSTIWAAYPSLANDTLAFVPYPYSEIATGKVLEPPTSAAAVSRNRVVLQRLASDWTLQLPRSATAFETLARARELEGRIGSVGAQDSSALAALHRARMLATNDIDRRRLKVMAARLLLVSGNFAAARMLADSVLASLAPAAATPADADELKATAALTGRIQRTIEMLRVEAPTDRFISMDNRLVQPPPAVAQEARALLGYASFGAPLDSLIATRERVLRSIDSYVQNGSRSEIREAVLNVPLTLAYPVAPAIALQRTGGAGDYLLDIQRAASRHDTASVHRLLDAVAKMRAAGRPGDLSIYLTYQEAWLRLQVGDSAGAVRQLDATLTALPTLTPYLFDYVQDAAFLVRAMALRSDIAAASGDERTAGKWGSAVAELWAGADAPLASVVARMKARATSGVR